MWKQKSFKGASEKGSLNLVATPIGNLMDMTYRAIEVLKEADLIAAEDTRNTRKLCTHFEIKTPLVSYHEHNKEESGEKLLQLLLEGKKIALVSDAGMPAISDPGYEIVRLCEEKGVPIIALPGANAALTALVASGLRPQPFYFYGFLHRNKKERRQELELMANRSETLLFYEAPHRIKQTLEDLLFVLGDRKASLCRELTKIHEEYIRGNLAEILEEVVGRPLKGEICLVIEGGTQLLEQEDLWWTSYSVQDHVTFYMEEKGQTSKEAIRQTARDRSLPKREVYQLFHIDGS